MIDQATLEDCRQLALTLAPELKERPLYLLTQVDIPSLPQPDHCHAWTPCYTNLAIADHLRDRGEWQGPGTTIVLLPSAAEGSDNPRDLYHVHRCLQRTIVHEVAHNVPLRPITTATDADTQAARDRQRIAYKIWIDAPDWRTAKPWDEGHGIGFVRNALHLHHRALRVGTLLPLHGLCAGHVYSLSHPSVYADLLGDEAERMRGATFAEIAATPAPPAFTDRFRIDCETWEAERQEMLAVCAATFAQERIEQTATGILVTYSVTDATSEGAVLRLADDATPRLWQHAGDLLGGRKINLEQRPTSWRVLVSYHRVKPPAGNEWS